MPRADALKIVHASKGAIMTDAISDASVALSLMLEALRMLDGPEHSKAAAHLRAAIEQLSPHTAQQLLPPLGKAPSRS
jgi:hypothetical protein